MKLKEMTIEQYISELEGNLPAPGGGSASALMGAQGAALISMVAKLTLGKEKYLQYEENCKKIILVCDELRAKLVEQIDLDTDAYNELAIAFKMPKETDEQKMIRKQAITKATKIATEVPYTTMKLCYETLEQVKKLLNGFNTNCSSDVGVAALNINGGLQGAYMNVKINLQGAEGVEERKLLDIANKMSQEAEKLTNNMIDTINNYL